jgi:MFS family permease
MTSSSRSTFTPVAPGDRWSARLWALLIVLGGALLLDALDVSMVGVALPSIRRDLGLSTASLQWVVSGYVLGYGGLLLLGGRAADLLGRRRVLLVALAAFAGASLLGGIASDGNVLIAARFVKGIAAAFTAPAGLSIITTTFPEGPHRNRAVSIYTTAGATGFSAGLVLSGLLTEVGWRWTFLLPVPVALIVLALAWKVIPRDGARVRGRGYDVPGAVTVAAAMLLLVFAVVQAPLAGWTSPVTIGSLAAVVALLAAFVAIERRSRHPLVRLGILRSWSLVRANLGILAFFGSYIGFQFVATLYLQRLAGWSPLQMALAFLPAAVMIATLAPRIGPLVDRVGTARLILIGSAALVVSYALFLRIGVVPNLWLGILPTILLIGVAGVLMFPTLNIQATSGIADHEQGLASGVLQTSQQLGGAIVLAVVTAVVTASGGDRAVAAPALLASYRPALWVVAGVAVLGLAVAVGGVALRRRRVPAVEPALDEAA